MKTSYSLRELLSRNRSRLENVIDEIRATIADTDRIVDSMKNQPIYNLKTFETKQA